MKHLFVPYNIALALKEKGFKEDCAARWWTGDGEKLLLRYTTGSVNDLPGRLTVIAPLYAQVVDWFREKHKIVLYVDCSSDTFWYWRRVRREDGLYFGDDNDNNYPTYYEALTAAIEHANALIP